MEFVKKNFPKKEAVDPKTIKTKEKPRVKNIVLKTIRFLFFFANLLNEVPDIYEIYPGINGRTQGDKKLINPAKKAIDSVVVINTLQVCSLDQISTYLLFFLKRIQLLQKPKLKILMKFRKQSDNY